ncbi:MAPK/MAK/MRK overlapping kinase-like [Neopelma chrysocephalum]|uniref:MAPK/MAK/MRK overlapping kinase-like n=1 Tax=Neopelma chrysocephalum TaxID=114329 RepID=UPI000FCD0CD2|nr:MAPK/MAK/MRK overlapping kinase-like [Neopelma chrysocephalum]
MKQHFERVHEAVIRSGLALSSPYGSFLGSNELDQISKIHNIIGTLGKTTLKKFKHKLSESQSKNGNISHPGKNSCKIRLQHLNKALQGNLYCCYLS